LKADDAATALVGCCCDVASWFRIILQTGSCRVLVRRRTRLQTRRRPWSSLLRQAPGAGGGSGIRRGASTAGAAPSRQRTRRMAAGRRLLRWRWSRVQRKLSLAASAPSVRGLVASSSIRQPRPASNGPSGFDAQSEAPHRRQGMRDSGGAMRLKLSAVAGP
jgi:hypothetical protein